MRGLEEESMTAGITNLTNGNNGNDGNDGVHLRCSFSPFEFGRSRPLLRSHVSRLRVPFPPCVRNSKYSLAILLVSHARRSSCSSLKISRRILLRPGVRIFVSFCDCGCESLRLILQLWIPVSSRSVDCGVVCNL
jgi:hypothetical protein